MFICTCICMLLFVRYKNFFSKLKNLNNKNCKRGHPRTTLTRFWPFLTTYPPLVDICKGISLLLCSKIYLLLIFALPSIYLLVWTLFLDITYFYCEKIQIGGQPLLFHYFYSKACQQLLLTIYFRLWIFLIFSGHFHSKLVKDNIYQK